MFFSEVALTKLKKREVTNEPRRQHIPMYKEDIEGYTFVDWNEAVIFGLVRIWFPLDNHKQNLMIVTGLGRYIDKILD